MSSTPTTRLLPDALKLARNSAGISQARLAELAEISIGYIGMIELGQRHPTHEVCQRLADALEVPLGVIAYVPEELEATA